MLNIELSWQQAAITSGCLLGAAATARVVRHPLLTHNTRLVAAVAFAREAGTLFGLFALWQFAGSFSLGSPDKAVLRGQWIWEAERGTHMPSETVIQRAFLPHPLLIQVCNLYYAALHFIVLLACLVWLFARYREQYRRVRTTVVLFTGISLLVQFVPVAPPRMLAGDGMIDTAIKYGQSVYGSYAGFEPDQLSAMPSVHIGWALLVAIVVVHVSRSRWRWPFLAYPVLTTGVVVITANHYWLDGVVAAVLLAAVLLVQRATRMAQRAATTLRARPRRASERLPSQPHPRWAHAHALLSLAPGAPYVAQPPVSAHNRNGNGNGSQPEQPQPAPSGGLIRK
jgi:PAP2 superfamily